MVSMSDKLIEHRLQRHIGGSTQGWQSPSLQSSLPSGVSLWGFGCASGVVPVHCPDTIVTLDGCPPPIRLQDVVRSQSLEDQHLSLLVVGVHVNPIYNSEGISTVSNSNVEVPLASGLSFVDRSPNKGYHFLQSLE